MDIAQKLHRVLSETKEMTLQQVMDKIDDGYWEAEEDVKKGKHVMIRDTKTKKKMTVYIKEDLDEASQEKDLDPKKKIVVKGVKGMKSKPFTKKFKNMDAYDKWLDTDEAGDFEVHRVMNEEFDDSELEDSLDEKFSVKCGLQGALSINGKSIAKVEKMGKNVAVMIERPDGDKGRIPVPGGKDMLASEIAEWLEDYLNKHPQVLKEEILEEGVKIPTSIKIGDKIKTTEGFIKITNIEVDSFHSKNPITFFHYYYDVEVDGEKFNGNEKKSIEAIKKLFF